MKTKITIIILLAASLSLSCSKLNEVVYSKLTDDNAFSTGENAQASVNGIYASLQSLYREPMFYINDIAADSGFKNGSCFEVLNDNANYNDNRTLNAWDYLYQIASRANIAIDNITNMAEGRFRDGIKKEQLLGEAYFMRAFAYYNLSDVFYRVPLITNSKIKPTDKMPLNSIEEIEYRIENDLFNAKDYLPKSYDSNDDAGRPTYGAACGYLAKLYMRQGGRARQNGDASEKEFWKFALKEVDNILNLEGVQYSLKEKIWDVFDPSRQESLYNNELIFAIRSSGKIVSGSWDLGMQFTGWKYDTGWGNIYQALEMSWKFDKEDERYKVLQVTEYEDIYRPDEKYYAAPESIEKTGKVNENHTINGKTYSAVFELAETYTQKYKYLTPRKYIYETPNNLPLLRLSDIILCKAEILNELNGPNQEVIDLINRIRSRAFRKTDHNLDLSAYTSKEELRSAICDERLFELNLECQRRPDLIRMGLWQVRMSEYIKTIAKKFEWREINEGKAKGYYDGLWAAYPQPESLKEKDLRMYMPIPEREVKLNGQLAEARNYIE